MIDVPTPACHTHNMTRRIVASATLAVAILSAALTLGVLAARADTPAPATTVPARPATAAVATLAAPCSNPTTVYGFTRMLAAVPASEWGGGDVSISVPMGNGRSVWLFGDTMTPGKPWAHSTAMVQECGRLHVSNGAAQLLPDEADGTYYWVNHAYRLDATHLAIVGDQTVNAKDGPWGFRATGYFRTAIVSVTPAGDVNFDRWAGSATTTNPWRVPLTKTIMEDRLYYNDGHHTPVADSPPASALVTATGGFSYNPQIHPEFPLQSGKTLVTVPFNHDGPSTGGWNDYRPHFYAVALPRLRS